MAWLVHEHQGLYQPVVHCGWCTAGLCHTASASCANTCTPLSTQRPPPSGAECLQGMRERKLSEKLGSPLARECSGPTPEEVSPPPPPPPRCSQPWAHIYA